ncbi:hypothetical protein AB1Y20_021816 [Prymnesium parvum]|uniref:Uncharacterized protein n=1 Tax=Prymnesium parvum TaxID=97485 RepID=A0AB34JLP2_PRYPA|mmetsp:Transcript_27934/g.69380  ORF Transcript_27934/g.69380 Transcript_27934/m.69380 type:complete len:136 (+) Transcript_27934:3-410(+)
MNFYLWGQPYVRTCQAIASLRKDSCELYPDGRLRKMTTHLPRDEKDLRGHHMKVNKPTIVRRTSLAGGADHVRHEPTIPEDAPGEVGAVEGEGAHAGPPNILAHLRCFRDPGAAMRRTWAKVRKRPADAAAAGLL